MFPAPLTELLQLDKLGCLKSEIYLRWLIKNLLPLNSTIQKFLNSLFLLFGCGY